MSVKKTSRGYQVSIYDADGRLRRKTYKGIDRKEADRLERVQLAARDRGELPPDEKTAPTFGAFAQGWLKEGRPGWKHSTDVQYTTVLDSHLLPAFKDLRVSQITESKVAPWLSQLRAGGLSPRRCNLVLTILRMILRVARRRRFIREDALLDVRRFKAPRAAVDPFSPEEIAVFLRACPSWWRQYFEVAFGTGLRPGEQGTLRWDDYDAGRATLTVRAATYRGVEATPKTESSARTIDVTPMVMDALKRQRAQQAAAYLKKGKGMPEPEQDFIFTSPNGNRVHPNHLRDYVWKRTLQKAKLRQRPSYQTRHTFASVALQAGEDPAWVARTLGHRGLGLLFDTYGAFIRNRSRKDGSAFASALSQATVAHERQQAADMANGA